MKVLKMLRVRGACMKTLVDALLEGSTTLYHYSKIFQRVLLWRSCQILFEVLV